MTLYYTLVFALLVLEIGIFLGLILPMPYKMKRALFTFISESPIVAKLQYGMKITFIFILILFIDSVNRVYRVQQELSAYSKEGVSVGAATLGSERMEVQARKFYSQRNMYLCGFTLFLSLILNRTYIMILEILQLEEKVKQYQEERAQVKSGSEEVARLKKELASREKDIEALKKQTEGLTREYHKLGDQVAQDTSDSTPKKDR
ncbi:hypothetical protein VTO42DRAFT_4702 [Malbranchea cinnamomea]